MNGENKQEPSSEEIELDPGKLERKIIAVFGKEPCVGPPYKGSGSLHKVRNNPITMLGVPVYPTRLVYETGEIEVHCHYRWGEKNCVVDGKNDTFCVHLSSRKIYANVLNK